MHTFSATKHHQSWPLSIPFPLQGLKLYWLTLEALVAAEGARPRASPGASASLLAAPLFHRCVAACCLEVVIGAYRMVTCRGLLWGCCCALASAHLPPAVPVSGQ